MAQRIDPFDADHLMSGITVTAAVALALVLAPTPVALPVLVVVAFVCGRLGGRDAGLGSVATGSFMFCWAIAAPHFRWEIRNDSDAVLLFVLFPLSLLVAEVGARLRLRHLDRHRSPLR
jgi:hypothetical protein